MRSTEGLLVLSDVDINWDINLLVNYDSHFLHFVAHYTTLTTKTFLFVGN